jgi:AraC-like DNA-binding protein
LRQPSAVTIVKSKRSFYDRRSDEMRIADLPPPSPQRPANACWKPPRGLFYAEGINTVGVNRVVEEAGVTLAATAMARWIGVSVRHLGRFGQSTGITPACYVELIRVWAATSLLDGGSDPLSDVATHAGFGSAETMRRALLRRAELLAGGLARCGICQVFAVSARSSMKRNSSATLRSNASRAWEGSPRYPAVVAPSRSIT